MDQADNLDLAGVLGRMVDSHGWHRAQWLTVIEAIWQKAVGEAVAHHTRILTLTSDGTLIVAVPSSVWSQELLYYHPAILAAIQAELPHAGIREIRTRVKAEAAPPPREDSVRRDSPYFYGQPKPPFTDNLDELLAEVQEKYETAAHDWLTRGYHPCAKCHSPTMSSYTLCIVCELSERKRP